MNGSELTDLQASLLRARGLLWRLIQLRGFFEPIEAEAAFDAYKAADKALKLTITELSQLPLQEKEEEDAEAETAHDTG